MTAAQDVDAGRPATSDDAAPRSSGASRRGTLLDVSPATSKALSAVLWPLAVMVMSNLVFRSYLEVRNDVDFRALHDGALRFVDGVSVYADPYFLLTPSGLLVVAPFGLLSHDPGFLVWNTLSVLAALVGVALSVKLVGGRLLGPLTAAVVLGFALTESLTLTLLFGNLNNTLLLALGAGFLLAETRRRWVLAGVLLGIALAIKPLFVLLLLIPLLRRGWSTIAWAVAIPAVANVVGFLLVPARQDFLDVTVPNLLTARPDINSSLWAVGTRFGVPELALTAVRGVVLVVALLVVWRLRHVVDPVVRTGTQYLTLLTAMYLASSLSETYYSMTFLPALLLVARRADSPLRNPLAWFAVYGFFAYDLWTVPQAPNRSQDLAFSRTAIAWTLLLVVITVWTLRHRPRPDGSTGTGDSPSTRTASVGATR
ncbi:arabinofuranan 3-O-arabinosyltransferase [Rhodococcus aerolatus]